MARDETFTSRTIRIIEPMPDMPSALSIKWLHVEVSSRCNAWCPACPRNVNGYGLTPGLIEQDLDIDRYAQVLECLPNLETVQMCGNNGDPLAHHAVDRMIDVTVDHVQRVQIHTNGGLRSPGWWQDLASRLSGTQHEVWFGIDGIGEVHEIYRQGTQYDRVIDNARAFISAGGTAVWQFIPFRHNEHQLRDCLRLSQSLGFRRFQPVHSFRTGVTRARHWRTGAEFELSPSQILPPRNITDRPPTVSSKDCMHLQHPSIYLSAAGQVSPCCYMDPVRSESDVTVLLDRNNIRSELQTRPDSVCQRNCAGINPENPRDKELNKSCSLPG